MENKKFRSGLEIHLQLDTKHKLFCNSLTTMKEKDPIRIVTRKQHPVASELGKIDIAAQHELLRNRIFKYQVFKNETCLVELDEEPPHPLNVEALEIAIQISLMLNCKISSEVQVMRKTVIDGSTPTSFQRTMIIGMDGHIDYKGRKVPITYVGLEEDASAIVSENEKEAVFRLNRLGVPLVEIDTDILEGFTPEEIQEIAFTIGMIGKSTRKMKRGIGSIRQDINISTKGDRVEIKGVQDLGMMSKIIEIEIDRQLSAKEISKETRSVNPDGTTKFTRPLPGANRMYPETDIPPVTISKETIQNIKKNLPEPLTEKLQKLKTKFKLSDLLAKEILRSDYLDLFEEIMGGNKLESSVVANTFVSVLKDLEKREKIPVESLTDAHFKEIFSLLSERKIAKEAIPEIVKHLAKNPDEKISASLKQLNLEQISEQDIEKIILEILKQPGIDQNKAIGLVMSKVRGKADAQNVIKLVKKHFEKK